MHDSAGQEGEKAGDDERPGEDADHGVAVVVDPMAARMQDGERKHRQREAMNLYHRRGVDERRKRHGVSPEQLPSGTQQGGALRRRRAEPDPNPDARVDDGDLRKNGPKSQSCQVSIAPSLNRAKAQSQQGSIAIARA
jgi:hypothetical protein